MNSQAVIAAGMLEAEGTSPEAPAADRAAVLAEIKAGPTIWVREQRSYSLDEYRQRVRRHVARWRAPTVACPDAPEINAFFAAAIDHDLRFEVSSLADWSAVTAHQRPNAATAAYVRRRAIADWQWRWPLRFGVLASPAAARRVTEGRGSGRYSQLYSVFETDGTAACELLLITPDRSGESFPAAAVVVVLGADPARLPADLLDVVPKLGSAGIAFCPADSLGWLEGLVVELSHDLPLDLALAKALPGAVLLADPDFVARTTVRQWGMELSAALHAHGDEAAAETLDGLLSGRYASEGGEATDSTRMSEVARNSGIEAAVRGGPPREAARPPARSPFAFDSEVAPPATAPPLGGPESERDKRAAKTPAPEVAPPNERRLITEFWVGNEKQRKILPPTTDVSLEIWIGIPAPDEIAADGPLPLPETTATTAILDVAVCSSLWSGEKRQQVSLPMARRDQPSNNSAVFEFTTGASGSVAEFDIVISHQNRPLQAATLTAAVREKSLPRDRVKLLTYPLSTPPEPAVDVPPVDVSLDGRGSELRNRATGDLIPLTAVGDLLDSIELEASQTLGRDDAPDDLDDPRALELLIHLARMGSELRSQLDNLGLKSARSIDVLVAPTSRMFPLELVYEAPAPTEGAKRCRYHRDCPPPVGETCSHASRGVVCPYAFWGVHRRITRTVKLDPKAGTDYTIKLHVDDVLYAAAVDSDHGAPPGQEPTRLIAESAQSLIGCQQSGPVTSWREWRKQVAQRHPALLILLAHTELTGREPALLIGKKSYLARPDVSKRDVRAEGSPAPIVLLMACASGALGDAFGSLPATFTANGAGTVVATLTKIAGRHGAWATREFMRALGARGGGQISVGDAVLDARRALIAQGVLLGLLLVSHGNSQISVLP